MYIAWTQNQIKGTFFYRTTFCLAWHFKSKQVIKLIKIVLIYQTIKRIWCYHY